VESIYDNWALAQFNILQMKFPFSDTKFDDFKDMQRKVQKVAEEHPRFIWRYQGEKDNLGYMIPYVEDPYIMGNLSVWHDMDGLLDYTYSGEHFKVLKNSRRWFTKINEISSVLWWIPKAHRPTIEEARASLYVVNEGGSSPTAFTIKEQYSLEDYLSITILD
jgi:hypothetical protein